MAIACGQFQGDGIKATDIQISPFNAISPFNVMLDTYFFKLTDLAYYISQRISVQKERMFCSRSNMVISIIVCRLNELGLGNFAQIFIQ